MRFARSTAVFLLGTLAPAFPAVAQTRNVVITTPSPYVAIEPGHYTDVPITITNHDTRAWPAPTLTSWVFPEHYHAEQRSLPQCGSLTVTDGFGSLSGTLAPIAPGDTLTCVVRISRDADETDNAFVIWHANANAGNGNNYASLYMTLGTLADIALAATPISRPRHRNGMLHASFRVTAQNAGNVTADNVVMGIGPVCAGPISQVTPDPASTCVTDSVECGTLGGPGGAVRFAPLAPGATQSCLIDVAAIDDTPTTLDAVLAPDRLTDAASGGHIDDPNPTNSTFELDLMAGAGQPVAFDTPTLAPGALALLAFLLLAVAALVPGLRRGD